MIKDLSKFSFLLFLSLTLVMTSCDDDDDEDPIPTPSGPTLNIAETAIASPQFTTLVAALQATDLVDAVSADGPLTVFAPNNDAFDAYFQSQGLPAGSTIDDVLATPDFDVETVRQLLLYHVIGSEIPAAAVTGKTYAPTSSTASPEDDALSLLAEPANNTVWVNGGSGKGATVIAADIFATNGVIHEIDGVLELPSVVDHAIFNSDLTTLVGAVTTADLVTTLDTTSNITVFAPTNDAFDQITVPTDVAELAAVLTYHVLDSQVRSGQIPTGTPVPTLN
ncbi:MAG: fasciclin domain-containing protein, partial [Cryomorphaceae bacterium]